MDIHPNKNPRKANITLDNFEEAYVFSRDLPAFSPSSYIIRSMVSDAQYRNEWPLTFAASNRTVYQSLIRACVTYHGVSSSHPLYPAAEEVIATLDDYLREYVDKPEAG